VAHIIAPTGCVVFMNSLTERELKVYTVLHLTSMLTPPYMFLHYFVNCTYKILTKECYDCNFVATCIFMFRAVNIMIIFINIIIHCSRDYLSFHWLRAHS